MVRIVRCLRPLVRYKCFGFDSLFPNLERCSRYIRQYQGTMAEPVDYTKRRMQDMAGYVGQKTKEAGQQIQSRAGPPEGRAQEGRT